MGRGDYPAARLPSGVWGGVPCHAPASGIATLLATEGLPPEFDFVARTLPLPDYADIADLPFSGAHGGCWGDFFAPIAAAYGMRSWLFLSITHPDTTAVQGSLLLGSRSPARFGSADTVPLFALAQQLSQRLHARFTLEPL